MSAFSLCFARDPSCSPTRRRCRCSIPVEDAPRPASSAYAADDRPWGGLDPPGIADVYAPDRKAERLFSHLAGFKGVLQVDGYNAYPKLAERGEVELAFCWVHMRRNFYELATAGPAPIASEALKHIAAFYAIEKEIRGRSAEERRLVRQQKSRPLADAFEVWLRAKLALISQKIKLAEAIRYALSRWQGGHALLTTTASSSTTIRSNGQSVVSSSAARMRCLADPTAMPNTGLSSRPWSRLASSTTSIRSPISPTS